MLWVPKLGSASLTKSVRCNPYPADNEARAVSCCVKLAVAVVPLQLGSAALTKSVRWEAYATLNDDFFPNDWLRPALTADEYAGRRSTARSAAAKTAWA